MSRFPGHGRRPLPPFFAISGIWTPPKRLFRKPAFAPCRPGRRKAFLLDPTAWLVTVGRNAALDIKRRDRPIAALADADTLADPGNDPGKPGREPLSRRHPAAVVRVRTPHPASDSADRARTAHRVRTHRRTDCESIPGVSRRDGAADHTRQANHRQGRRRIRNARCRRTAHATSNRLDDDLSHLQRGVRKHPGPRRCARGARGRSHPAGAAAAPTVSNRAGDFRTAGPDAAPAIPRTGALRREWRNRVARRAGSEPLESCAHR